MSRIPDQTGREQMGRPMRLSILFHFCVLAALVLAIFLSGLFHGAQWGNNTSMNSIQATLVSSAPSLPLPQIVPPNKDVLATQTPSQAPAIPQEKTVPVPTPDAIPIKAKPQPKKKVEHQKVPQRVQPKKLEHRANYGERQEASIPHARQTTQTPTKTVMVNNGGSFASLYGWYVTLIQQKVSSNWFVQEVDPSTPAGTTVTVTFQISASGGLSDVQISQRSGSATLNSSGVRAIERVGNFPPLPQGYQGRYINVGYTFTYPGASQ